MRANDLKDFDLNCVIHSLRTNSTIKVIDISSNSELSSDTVTLFFDVLNSNRTLEYFGLAKLNLENHHILPIFDMLGKFPFPEDQVQNHLAALKNRDAIVEKNKKLKAGKKPEEIVPVLDNIEQITTKNEEGQTVQIWVTIKNPQFKHLNLCMNNIDDEIGA